MKVDEMVCAYCNHTRNYPEEFPVSHYAKCWWCYDDEENKVPPTKDRLMKYYIKTCGYAHGHKDPGDDKCHTVMMEMISNYKPRIKLWVQATMSKLHRRKK